MLWLPLLVLWSLVLRAPLFNLDGPDESFFAEVARLWATGHPPYLAAFDVKPPGFFAILALAQGLFGASLATLRALSVLSDACAAAALLAIGRRLAAPRAGAFAALLYPVLSAWVVGNDCYPVLAAIEALAFAAALGPLSALRRAWLAGLAIGAAVSVKQTAVLEAAALLATMVRADATGGRRVASLVAFCVGAMTIPLAFVAYFASVGGLHALVADVWFAALQRPEIDAGGPNALFGRSLSVLGDLGPLFLVAALAALGRRFTLPGARPVHADAIALWFAATLLGVLLQQSRWLTYVGPALAPSLLLAGAAVERAFAARPPRAFAVACVALAASIVVFAYPVRIARFLTPFEAAAVADATRAVAARAPAADDRLLAIDFGGWLNLSTGLAPPTPYFHRLHLLCRFPGAGPGRLAEALAANPRFVVFGHENQRNTECENSPLPGAVATLARDYEKIGEFRGTADVYELFEARASPRPAAP